MEHEMEVAGLGSAGGLSHGEHHPVRSGQPCANCGAIVEDRYCSTCGQLASNFHRPVWHLVMTSLADTFALDGRLNRSLPMLLFRPGRMTRNYLEGKRARYVPPFRLFLLSSVLFFLTLFTLGDQLGWYDNLRVGGDIGEEIAGTVTYDVPVDEETPVVDEDYVQQLREELVAEDTTDARREEVAKELANVQGGINLNKILTPSGEVDREALREAVEERVGPDATPAQREQMWRTADHAATVYENQDKFGARIREWAPRFSLFFMPILALLLALLYAWHRKRYIYDHVITALHIQTFIYFMLTGLLLLGALLPHQVPWLIAFGLTAPVIYIYKQLRVTYDTGRFMSLMRTWTLLFISTIILSTLSICLVVLSFYLV
ncbi:hypothetical protein HY29_13580 [Hyphomonas beringensis]|uniref:DUF3667 domain-containing protein n=1 Tax=Hyphomonas beringensis TaxID=1280946 RepID=A0A062UDR0_9PROT|nr:DUF3667 domain-containing protein [Hyphomonas beringensis]KCZ54704.1 hypothetical protein HY29_13580 [Hyphomonas beringensis]